MKSRLISFVLGETTKAKKGKEVTSSPTLKSAPHYFEATVPQQFIVSQDKITIRDREGTLTLKTYQPDALLAEASFEFDDIFSEDTDSFREEVLAYCKEILKKKGVKDLDAFSEEYSIYTVSDYEGDPEQFLKYKDKIAGLLKSEKLALDPLEIEYTLSAQLKYAKNDLVVVDWDGAFIFDPDADFASTIELLELANYQLLQYRLLDSELDKRIRHVAEIFEKMPEKKRVLFGRKDLQEALRTVIRIRATSLFEFHNLEREIKLIGDWYSARLYELAAKKFKFEEWRSEIKEKLDNMEEVYSVVSERFSLSPERLEMIGWFVLLFGWGVIMIFDLWVAFFK